MDEKIPMPTGEERQAAIRRIVELSGVEQRARRRSIPLSVVFFGVEDCLFLPVLAALLCLIPGAAIARFDPMAPMLFLFSPALYAALHLLTAWKDTASGVAEWRRSCKLSACTLLALRMLVFGGLAVIVCVPANILLWLTSGQSWSLAWMLGLSFSSLFLYAALTLFCLRFRRGMVLPPAFWGVTGLLLLVWERGGELLFRVPVLVLFFLSAAGLAYCVLTLERMLRYPNRGGRFYAYG